MFWTEETFRIFEYDRAEKPSLDMVLQRIHPHDRALAQQVIEGVSKSTDFEHECRLLLPDGRIKHIHAIACCTECIWRSRVYRGRDRHHRTQDYRGQDPAPGRCRYSGDLLRQP